MTTFALVHGAWHGGWCWQRLIPELAARGHRAVAMDLPTDDPQAGAEHYAASVVQALEGFDEDVVLVGHSLAGLTIPVGKINPSILAMQSREPLARVSTGHRTSWRS